MTNPNTTIRLELPAVPASIAIVRAVLVSLAGTMPLPYDGVDDLRIASAEAAALLVPAAGEDARLCVEFDRLDDGLGVTMWVQGSSAAAAPDHREGLGWQVIQGLTDEAAIVEAEGNPAIRLRIQAVS